MRPIQKLCTEQNSQGEAYDYKVVEVCTRTCTCTCTVWSINIIMNHNSVCTGTVHTRTMYGSICKKYEQSIQLPVLFSQHTRSNFAVGFYASK